jgi:peptidoglycan/LPS O-acetylase OafA/YrhL
MFHTNIFYANRDPLHIPILDQGYTGVALFMVISGLILTLITYGKEVDVRKFYLNRVLRIYPLFVFVVTLGYFSTPDGRETAVGIDYVMSLLPISNLYRLKYGAYGGHFWSVMVEMQFYLLFPALAFVLGQRGQRFYIGLIGFMILLRALLYMLNGTVHKLAYFSIFGSLDLFLIGCLAGIAYKKTEGQPVGRYWWVLAFALANAAIYAVHRTFGFMQFDYSRQVSVSASAFWIVWPTLQGLMWAVLILAYLKSPFVMPLSQMWSYLGRISYSLYAWHIIVCLLVVRDVPALLGSPYLTGLAVVRPLTVGLSALSYYFIESPFLMLRFQYVRPVRAPLAGDSNSAGQGELTRGGQLAI